MSYRDLRNFSEHLLQLGYPRSVSLESFREPNFPLLAELLRWLVQRFDPEADISGGPDSVEERVTLIRTAAKFMATKANIKLNLKRLYGADGYAVRELIKMTSVLCAALAGAGGATAAADADVSHLNYDVSSKIGEIKQARQLATEITAKGAVLYDLLAKEPEYKELRERAPARQLDMGQVEACLTRAAEVVRARTEAAREQATAAAASDRAILAKIEKRKGELERAEMRLQSIQKIKPAYQGELAGLEAELETLWDQYVLRHRCVEALKHQLSLVERTQAEVAEQQQAAVLQLIHKYEAEDVLGNVSDSDDMNSTDEKNMMEQKEPRPATRPKTRLRIKTAGGGGQTQAQTQERRGVYGSMAGGGRDELDDVPDEDDSHSDSDDLVSELARATSRYGRRSTMRMEESLLTRYSARAQNRAPPPAAAARRRQLSADDDDDDDFGDLLEGDEEPASLGSSDESELQMGAGVGSGQAAAAGGGASEPAGAGSARARRAPSTKPSSLHDILSDEEF